MAYKKLSIHEDIKKAYGSIAKNEQSCCCSSCGSVQFDPAIIAKAAGYDPLTLKMLPQGANMGLSCGTPVEIADLKLGETVLDLGSGGGIDGFLAGIKVGSLGQVIGVDMTPEMVEKATHNAERYKTMTKLSNVEFRLGQIENLPLDDSTVDVVLSNCVINLSPDKFKVWSEIYRVLKPGGRVVISDMALLKPLPEKISTQVFALVSCVAGAVLIAETKRMLEAAGFSKINLTPKPDYLKQAIADGDQAYSQVAQLLDEGENLSDYVTSLTIEARK